nr:uncharacterized protein LOC121131141 [Lepeophtheirus salmonis]
MATLRMFAGTLSAAIIGMTYVYLGGSLPYNYFSDCPHRMFVNKHLCVDCKTLEDALEFSQDRQTYGRTNVNTMFLGSSDFEFREGGGEGVCVNKNSRCVLLNVH